MAHGIVRKDFLNHLMELTKKLKENPDDGSLKDLNSDMVLAQSVIFFAAGYETVSSGLSMLSYHLAKNPEVQEKVYQEVMEVMERHDGKLDHETISDMDYLEAAVNETLRMSGSIVGHYRRCSKDTEVIYFLETFD